MLIYICDMEPLIISVGWKDRIWLVWILYWGRFIQVLCTMEYQGLL
ncbi:hypothetical protein [Eisenbergiella tayi]|nr:hypothetical protein [Eisenbergiella tayi]EGN41513.1 hypothetical protein HMPREF0994_02108 [Lachnospiraceae bacterium 3_1_57FAA_CT1]